MKKRNSNIKASNQNGDVLHNAIYVEISHFKKCLRAFNFPDDRMEEISVYSFYHIGDYHYFTVDDKS